MEANAGEYIKKYLHLKRFPRISLHCELVPVPYREYEYGLFFNNFRKEVGNNRANWTAHSTAVNLLVHKVVIDKIHCLKG